MPYHLIAKCLAKYVLKWVNHSLRITLQIVNESRARKYECNQLKISNNAETIFD